MVISTTHDGLVRLLVLDPTLSAVIQAYPTKGALISLSCWLNKILIVNTISKWQETLIMMGHAEPVVKRLDDIDAISDFLLGHIQCNPQGAIRQVWEMVWFPDRQGTAAERPSIPSHIPNSSSSSEDLEEQSVEYNDILYGTANLAPPDLQRIPILAPLTAAQTMESPDDS